MTESTTQVAEKPWAKSTARIGWALLILATLYICYFSHLGAIGFVGPDEPRYAWVARDMVETGDWVTPRLYGKPWFEKPVLYYWGAAVCFKLFGVSEAAARLPSAISALLATLAMAWLALRLYGAETARWLLLLLPTTVGMIGFSHAAATDMPFSGMLTVAMVAAAVVLGLTRGENTPVMPRTSWLALALFGVFLGAAVLAKGPAAIILCGGAAFFWAFFAKRWRDAFRLLHPAAIAAFCLTALPWYILCARRNPDFFRTFIIEHNFKRYLTPEFQHIQPFWFYGPILFIGLFPWVGMALSAIINTFRRKLELQLNTISIFVLTWGLFPIFFFSISKSKLPGYVLPAIPAFVLLAAHALTTSLRVEKVPVPMGFAVLGLTPVVAVATVGLAIYFNLRVLTMYGFASGLLALLATTSVLVFAFNKKHRATLLSGILTWVCFMVITCRAAMPWLDSKVSPRPIARNILIKPEIRNEITTLRLQRSWQYGLNFYLHRELKEWDGSETSQRNVISSLKGIDELTKKGIPYQLLDDTSLDAILIRIGQSTSKDRKESSTAITRLVSLEKQRQEGLAAHPPRSGKPQ